MASINRLAIRGIRSFSPTDEEQSLDFYFPFTVIAGSNGCGKTTIIEAIKYAITGALPPGGSKAGQNFVHDPRAIGSTLVKAQVKLRFTSRSSQSMVVVRSMEVSQKKTTASFKQLDGALRTHDETTGKRVTLSHKCGELDKQLPQLLGISKAILDHVLFCHQEDSSWPLSEASVLKKRFDEIFDSTRYSKAITIFKTTEKDMNAKVKELQADIAGLKSHQHAAHGFRKELNEANESIEELDEEKKHIDEEIAALEEKIHKYRDIELSVSAVEAELDAAQQSKTNQMNMVLRLRSMLEENLTDSHSLRELEKMLRDYDEKVSNQKEELEDLQSQDQVFNDQIDQLRRKERDMTQEKARLDADRESHEKNCRERYQMMENIAQTYSVDMTQTGGSVVNMSMDASFAGSQSIATGGLSQDDSLALQITSDDMQAFMGNLDKKENELAKILKDTKARHQANEDKLLKDLAGLEAKRASIEAEREKLSKSRRDANRELQELKGKTEGPVRVRKSDVEETRRKVATAVKQRDEATNDPRREQIPVEIRRLEEKVDAVKRRIEDDRIALDSLRLCADAENQISMLREQCTKDLELLEETMRESSYVLQKHNLQPMENIPSYEDDDGRALVAAVESFVDRAQEEHNKQKSTFSKSEDEIGKSQRSLNEMQAIFASKQQNLQSINGRINSLKDGPVALAEETIDKLRKHEADEELGAPEKGSPMKDFVSYIDGRIQRLEEDSPLDDSEYSVRLLKKLRKLAKKKADDGALQEYRCPCCSRSMDDDEYGVFKESIADLMEESPLVAVDQAMVDKHSQMKAMYTGWRKVLSDSSSEYREYERLQKEAATLETELQQLREDVATQKASLSQLKEKSKEDRSEMDEARELVDTCKRWADDARRIKDKRMQINQKNDELTVSATSGRDLKTVEKELQERTDEKEEAITTINKLNKDMSEINNKVSLLATQASNLENLLRDKETKFAESQKANDRKNELHIKLQKVKEEEAQLQDQLVPLTRQHDTLSREKERSRSARESEEKERMASLSEFQAEVKDLGRLTSVIEAFEASDKMQRLEEHASKVTDILEKIKGKQKEKDELAPKLAQAASSVENQERYKKLLRDNIDLINEEEKIKTIEEDVERLQEEMSKIEGADEASQKLQQAEASKQNV